VITHHLVEHAPGWEVRRLRGRGTTSHIPVVANREPVDVDADSHAIPRDPLAYDRWPVQFLRTPIVAEIAECAVAGYKEKAGTAKRPGPE
jgi:hypothetical protein